MNDQPQMRLENWFIHFGSVSGEVYGNPAFDDGERVRTSTIKSIEGDILTTRNSVYKLGKKASS